MKSASLVVLLALASTAHGFVITPSYSSSPDWTPELESVITQACTDWTSRLALDNGNNQNITVNFQFANAGTAAGTYLAYWSFSRPGPVPRPYSYGMTHYITVNADFLPLSHFSLDAPASGDGYDFLTVVEHELGHALGFANFTYISGFFDPWSTRIVNGVFDPDGLAVPMNSDKSHVAVPADLMYFSLAPGVRKSISDTDLAMLSLAYGYSAIPEPASLGVLSAGMLVLLKRPRQRR